jgi:dGTPase
MIQGVICGTTAREGRLAFAVDPVVGESMQLLRTFLFHHVYRSEQVHAEFMKATKILKELYGYYFANKEIFERQINGFAASSSHGRRVCDYIASMTDRFAQNLYQQIFLPKNFA